LLAALRLVAVRLVAAPGFTSRSELKAEKQKTHQLLGGGFVLLELILGACYGLFLI
jgi:hypothetical protein